MSNTPQIRFAGFTDAWEQRKVGDVLSESRDAGHSGDIAKKLTVKLWGKGVYAKDDKGSAATQYFTRHAGQFIYSKLDFLNSAFGVVPQELESYESTADLPAFDCVGVEPYFVFYRAIQPSFYLTNGMIADGSRKAKRIHVETFLDMPLDLPSIEEQQKVASYFIQLDSLITLHQRKCDALQKFKKSMLQKMFPQNGESVPEIRFAGFTDAWEQRKLGECAEFNPKSELPDIFEYVDLESVVGTDILSHRTESKSSAPSRAQRLARKGDVFYQTVRPYQKNNCIFENDENNWVFSTGYAQLRPVNDGYFLLTLLQNEDFVKLVLDRCTGTSYPAINSNDLADIDVNIPIDNLEQHKIGDYFRNLDTLITLHQRKLETLQKMKKSLLQKMFV